MTWTAWTTWRVLLSNTTLSWGSRDSHAASCKGCWGHEKTHDESRMVYLPTDSTCSLKTNQHQQKCIGKYITYSHVTVTRSTLPKNFTHTTTRSTTKHNHNCNHANSSDLSPAPGYVKTVEGIKPLWIRSWKKQWPATKRCEPRKKTLTFHYTVPVV